jgi:hypothetical protein
MQAFKLILNALVIGALNLASFVIGYFIFKLSGRMEQMILQGAAAMIVSVALVVFWLVGFRHFNRLKIEFDYVRVFLLVFPCTPFLFVPVHFLVTGYLTDIGNIVAIAAYQFPMNVLALAIGAAIIRKMEKAPLGDLSPKN